MIAGMATEPRIGTIIRRARLRKRWTKQQLADATDVSLRTIYDWETGRSYPRNPVAVEEVLGITLPDRDEWQSGDSGGGALLSDAERKQLKDEYERLGALLFPPPRGEQASGQGEGSVHDVRDEQGRTA